MRYKNFKQTDSKWKDEAYSGGVIKSQGCGPTSIADAVYDLNSKITPADTAKWMEEHGCSCHGSGTYYSGMVKALKHYGYSDAKQLNYTSLYGKKNNSVVTDFIKKIQSGKYVGIACMGKSIWTDSGHYVFVHKITSKYIYIYDPYSSSEECEKTTRTKWEQYVKYLFLFKKPTMYVTTKKKIHKRKEPKSLTNTKSLGKFSKGTRLAIDKVNGKFYHVMYHDVWIYSGNVKKVN